MPCEIALDRGGSVALYRQIYQQLRAAVIAGTVASSERLPSVRKLAARLSVNPLTVSRAFNKLEQEGLVESRWGNGVFALPMQEALHDGRRHDELAALVSDFLQRVGRLGFSAEEAAAAVREMSP